MLKRTGQITEEELDEKEFELRKEEAVLEQKTSEWKVKKLEVEGLRRGARFREEARGKLLLGGFSGTS